jgi:hypothetical protein
MPEGFASELAAVVDPTRAASDDVERAIRLQPPEGSGIPDPRPFVSWDETVVAVTGEGVSKGPGTVDTVFEVSGNVAESATRGTAFPDPTGTAFPDPTDSNTPDLPGFGGLRLLIGLVVAALLAFSFGQLFNINLGN